MNPGRTFKRGEYEVRCTHPALLRAPYEAVRATMQDFLAQCERAGCSPQLLPALTVFERGEGVRVMAGIGGKTWAADVTC